MGGSPEVSIVQSGEGTKGKDPRWERLQVNPALSLQVGAVGAGSLGVRSVISVSLQCCWGDRWDPQPVLGRLGLLEWPTP